jgi:hypothetical protein
MATTRKKAAKKRTVKAVAASPAKAVKAEPKAKKVSVTGLIASLQKPKAKKKTARKDDKPLITLEGRADELLKLQQAKAAMKLAEGTVKSLEGSLFGDIEEQRLAVSASRKSYCGSIKVTATGVDENGKRVDPGVASYYIMNKYKTFNFFDGSDDEDMVELYGDDATIKHEAIHALMEIFNGEDTDEGDDDFVDFDEAEEMLDSRMIVEHSLALDPSVLACDADGTPEHPEVIAILQEHLAPFLVSVTKVKPTKAFHESSNFDPTEKAIMQGLNSLGLACRYKAVLKPSGAPKQ